jgi:cytosine deaminase
MRSEATVTVTAATFAGDPFAADLAGRIVLPAFAEPHLHLDTALTADARGAPLRERARRAVFALLRNGTTVVRAHTDAGAVEVLIGLRSELAGVVDLQIVTPAEALAGGADAVGGAPRDTAELDALLEVAAGAGVAVDLHVDADTLPLLLERVEDGFPHAVVAAHLTGVGERSEREQAQWAERLAAAGVGVVLAPSADLRQRVRGASARLLLDAGVNVAAGGDRARDAVHRTGRLDPLETAGLLVAAHGLAPHEALAAVSGSARRLLGLPALGQDEVVVIAACSAGEAIAAAPAERVVSRLGQVVASAALEAWVIA